MFMRWARGLIFVLIIGSAGSALSQQTRPATAPDARTASPRGALRVLNEAMHRGDVDRIKQLFLSTSPSERRMVEADAQMASALAGLRRAAKAAFGPRGADQVTGDSDAGIAEAHERIDNAQITIDGDTATVVYKDEKESPFVLKKVGDRWRIPVSELGKPLDPAALDQRLADLTAQRKVVLEITREIQQAHFATAQEAADAWRNRMLKAATSQPATIRH